MKKIIGLVVLLFLVVGMLFVVSDVGCPSGVSGQGTQESPCIIPSDRSISINNPDNWYTFGENGPNFEGDQDITVPYFFNPNMQRIEPELQEGDFENAHDVLDTQSNRQYIFFTTQNTPSNPSASTATAPPDEDVITIRLPGGTDAQLTFAAYEKFRADCATDINGCTITDRDHYTTADDTEVTVRDDATIRRNIESNEASITSNGNTISMTSRQYDNLPLLADADSISLASSDSLTYTVGDHTESLVRGDSGVIEIQDADGNPIRLLVGNEIIENEDGEWVYGGRTYSQYDSESGTLRAPGIALTFGEDHLGRQQVTETSGTQSTTTTFTEDGGQIVTVREDNKVISRKGFDETGQLIWEDEEFEPNTLVIGIATSRTYYNEQGRPSGWCGVTNPLGSCDGTLYIFDWSPACYGQYDNPSCYSQDGNALTAGSAIPAEFKEKVYNDQLWNGEASTTALDFGRAFFSHPLSFYALANEWEGYREWMQDVDAFFASTYLQEEPFVSALCEIDLPVIFSGAPTGLNIIRTPTGFQSAGHVVAERIDAGPLLCDDEGKCPASLECREDQFCYAAGEEEPTSGYLYKIDWGVNAPQDEELIGAGRGAGGGQEIKFNLAIYDGSGRKRFLFADAAGRATEDTLVLKKGERSASQYAPLIAEYSPETFMKICIEWSDNEAFVPHTIEAAPTFGGGSEPLSDICDEEIPTTEPGRTLESATDPTGVSQSRTIRYCTLSGC